MPGTLKQPVCVAPTRPDELKLVACAGCAGNGCWPTETFELVPCLDCGGTGWAPVYGNLGSTHAHKRKGRPFAFQPGTNVLAVTRGAKTERYKLSELPVDQVPGEPDARAFEAEKASTGELHHVHAGRWVTCTCAGRSFESSGKANWRASLDGGDTFATFGCVHCDAVAVLLAAGLFDPPNPAA